MRVLQVVPSLSPEWGGPVTVVTNLVQGLVRNNIETTVFAVTGRRVGERPVKLDGVRTCLFKTDLLARLWTGHAPELAKELRREVSSHDLVHIHELWHYPHYAAYRAAQWATKPYLITIHGELDAWALSQKSLRKRVYMALWQRRILAGAAALQAITEEEKRQVQVHGVWSPVAVIPNGVHPEAYQNLPPRTEFEQRHPELAGGTVILFLGRIHPKKGLDLLARAFGGIVRDRRSAFLVIAGPDEDGYRGRVEAMLEAEGALGKTVFTGALSGRDKLAALGAADVFVLPSYSEGFSVATLEAMASGLPVVVSRQCFFPEVAGAGAGLIVETDVNELASALIRLIDDPEERQRMGVRGQALVRERYNWDTITDKIIGLYEGVLRESRREKTGT